MRFRTFRAPPDDTDPVALRIAVTRPKPDENDLHSANERLQDWIATGSTAAVARTRLSPDVLHGYTEGDSGEERTCSTLLSGRGEGVGQ